MEVRAEFGKFYDVDADALVVTIYEGERADEGALEPRVPHGCSSPIPMGVLPDAEGPPRARVESAAGPSPAAAANAR